MLKTKPSDSCMQNTVIKQNVGKTQVKADGILPEAGQCSLEGALEDYRN